MGQNTTDFLEENVRLCILLPHNRFFKWSYGGVDEDRSQAQEEGLLDPEDGGITLLWNIDKYFPVDTTPHTIRRKSLCKIIFR